MMLCFFLICPQIEPGVSKKINDKSKQLHDPLIVPLTTWLINSMADWLIGWLIGQVPQWSIYFIDKKKYHTYLMPSIHCDNSTQMIPSKFTVLFRAERIPSRRNCKKCTKTSRPPTAACLKWAMHSARKTSPNETTTPCNKRLWKKYTEKWHYTSKRLSILFYCFLQYYNYDSENNTHY